MRGTLTHRSSYSNFEDKETNTQVVEDQAKGRGTRRVANRHTCRLTSTSRIKPRGTHTHTQAAMFTATSRIKPSWAHTQTHGLLSNQKEEQSKERNTQGSSQRGGAHTHHHPASKRYASEDVQARERSVPRLALIRAVVAFATCALLHLTDCESMLHFFSRE